MIQMMEMMKMVSELQSDPNSIKKFSPIVEQVIANYIKSIPPSYIEGHAALFLDYREGKVCVTIANINTDSQVQSVVKMWFSELMEQLELTAIPAVLGELANGPKSWEEITDECLIPPDPEPVTTFEEFVNDEDQEFNRLARHFKAEFNDTQATLRNLIAKHFDESWVEPMLNTMMLDANWSEDYYAKMCRGLFYQNEQLLTEITDAFNRMD